LHATLKLTTIHNAVDLVMNLLLSGAHIYKMWPCLCKKRFSANHSTDNVPDHWWSPFGNELLVWSWLGAKQWPFEKCF